MTQHLVGIGNLKVVLFEEDNMWYAQGLEIDYLADGKTISEAKDNFSKGLKASITMNLQTFGNLNGLLRLAPTEVWHELAQFPAAQYQRFSSISLHETNEPDYPAAFPFSGVEFYKLAHAAAL